jgi:uracil phosphoribosyltransferase
MYKKIESSTFNQDIYVFQSQYSRALQVGYIEHDIFVPGRLLFGPLREQFTFEATKQSFKTEIIQSILHTYEPQHISTITLLRETLSCRLGSALWEAGINNHYGDAFIGATHIKGTDEITTAYMYENIEGLNETGLWILADSICMGRNLAKTITELLKKSTPNEILLLAPLASRRGINTLGEITASHNIPTTFFAWGGLIGVSEKNFYDMPWGHPDTEPLDLRDQELFISIYGKDLCIGGDFGNNYYSPTLAKQLYEEQLKEHSIHPSFPTIERLRSIYTLEGLLTINE